MIIKTAVRGNGGKLADYLLKDKKNDRAELLELRGWTASTLNTAFRLSETIAQQKTHCEMPFYHVSFRLPAGEELTPEQWAHCADTLEKRLGLEGHHRALVMHTYKGEKHLHAVWDRIDEHSLKAAELKYEHLRCKDVARALEKELGLQRVRNQKRDPERELGAATMAEEQQARRKGQDLKETRSALRDAWEQSTDGQGFVAALDKRGFRLAQGDKRDYVAIDEQGSVYSLGKRTTGATAREVRAKLADLDRERLPTVEQAREELEARQQAQEMAQQATKEREQAQEREDVSEHVAAPECAAPEVREPWAQAAQHAATPERTTEWKPEPTREARDSERHEGLQAANEPSDRFRVVDKETGLERSVSAFAGKALDYLATQAEGVIEGIASLFDGGSAPPRRSAQEPTRTPKSALQRLQERAARERALQNISQSVKRGDDLNAADLRALPPVELERLREGGDDYLKRLVKRHDREREERDRGRERER